VISCIIERSEVTGHTYTSVVSGDIYIILGLWRYVESQGIIFV